ncbi:T9SS type B sorting domain-containing protein [Seonamhaeicola sp. NFXS20]|uniref:T9SS type B sorting domain-containing protein n=1 Tax=Seonamhaeicola sp. NFXS20 TaxID=2816959 RepID=UPI003B8CF424
MKKIILSLILSVFSMLAFSQRQASNWYFGYGAGIAFDLTNNSINTLNNGQLSTNEGCSSISDDSGNLLFYTDGTTVWNKNHSIMMNGSGLFGNNSSTQSAIIVPKPDDENIYYIFTVDTIIYENDTNDGFNYSVVDMTLDGGLGGVTQKNTNLLQLCSEKLTAVLKDCITKSIWVITLASENGTSDIYNTFHAFEVSNLGVSTTPVKSYFPSLSISDKRGYLKVSPDGTKMASASIGDGLQLFDFDPFTGQATNMLELTIDSSKSPFPYGIEFSPNSQLLYVHAYNDFNDFNSNQNNNNPENHKSVLSQFDLTAPNIQNSQVILDDRSLYRGGLQLGPNGKIYRALSATYSAGLPYLGVINNPNNIGIACNYQHNAVSLSPYTSSQGLPPFIASFFNEQIDIINNGESATNLDLCDGESYTLSAPNLSGASYTWSLDGTVLSEADYDLDVTQSGYYEVYIDPNNGDCAIEGNAFVLYNPNPTPINHTILQCDEDGIKDGLTLFNLNEANISLTGGNQDLSTKFYTDIARTQEVNGSSFQNTTNPQTIYVEVINDNTGCFSYSELTLEVSVTNSNNITIEVCDDDGVEDGYYNFNLTDYNLDVINGLPSGLEISYFETLDDALLETNQLLETYKNTTPYNQTIYARVENANNCYGISEITLTVFELPDINTEEITQYCLNFFPSTITINAGLVNDNPANYSYNWSTGENTYTIEINEAKEYVVTVTNSNMCSKTRTILVEPSNIATIDGFEIEDASQNNTVTVFASGEGEYQYRLLNENNTVYREYQDSNVFENVSPGFYTVSIKDTKNNCGTINENISVIGFPKFFTPNNDGNHDTWQLYGVSSMFYPNTKIKIFDRYGKLLKELSPLSEGWDGLFNGKKLPSDDYWFYVKLEDGRIFKNHFTLKN